MTDNNMIDNMNQNAGPGSQSREHRGENLYTRGRKPHCAGETCQRESEKQRGIGLCKKGTGTSTAGASHDSKRNAV